MILTHSALRNGIWSARLQCAGPVPALRLCHGDQELPVPMPQADGDESYLIEIAVPAQILNDGIQTLVLENSETGMRLGHLSIQAGEMLDPDLRAELDLLRSELDLLKTAFRRHCEQGAQP